MDRVVVIEQRGNVILILEKEKDNILTNSNTLAGERKKGDECSVLLRMVL